MVARRHVVLDVARQYVVISDNPEPCSGTVLATEANREMRQPSCRKKVIAMAMRTPWAKKNKGDVKYAHSKR